MSGGKTAGGSRAGASASRAEHPGDSWSPVPAASLQQSPPPGSVRSALALKGAFYCVVVYRIVLHFYLFVKKVYFSQHCMFFHVVSGLLEQESSARSVPNIAILCCDATIVFSCLKMHGELS